MASLTTNLHSQKMHPVSRSGEAGPQAQERRLVSSGVEGPDVVVALQTRLWPKKGLLLFIYLFVCLAESGVSRGTRDLP